MELKIGARRSGKTTELITEFVRRLAQGSEPFFITMNEPERKRVIEMIREQFKDQPAEAIANLEAHVVTIDGAVFRDAIKRVADPASLTELLIDNIDEILKMLLPWPIKLMTATDIQPTKLQPYPGIERPGV